MEDGDWIRDRLDGPHREPASEFWPLVAAMVLISMGAAAGFWVALCWSLQ